MSCQMELFLVLPIFFLLVLFCVKNVLKSLVPCETCFLFILGC